MGKKYFRGFTLTEILIVVSLIVFLVLMAMIFLRTQLFKGNDAKRKTDLKKIQIAVEEYEKDHDCYPLPELIVCNPGTGLEPYISKVPCDPTTKASYYYDYQNDSCPSWYRLYANLENEADESITGSYTFGPGGSGYNICIGSADAPGCSLVESGSFYGCKSGSCVPIYWDASRPGPECDPNYQSATCYGRCGPPSTECKPWN